MHADLDTLVIALYVMVDELFGPRRGPGRKPKLSDAELVCLAVAQVLLGCDSERRWLRFADRRLGHLFPYLPTPSAYNKRLRRAGPLVALALQDLAAHTPSWYDQLRLVDSTPGALCGQPGDGQALGPVALCRLWLLQQPPPLLLGLSPVCAGHPGRHAGHLVSGHPQAGGTGGAGGAVGPRALPAAAGAGHRGRQGVRRPGLRAAGRRL